MTEGDKKAWDSHYRFIEQDILSGYWRRYIANPEAYKFAFRAGRDSKGDGWVPIADIPEEWKDGRDIDLCIDGKRVPDCTYCIDVFWDDVADITFTEAWICGSNEEAIVAEDQSITHAMPPPQPSQDRKEG